MAERMWRLCRQPSCSELTRNASGYCDEHAAAHEASVKGARTRYEKKRGGSTKAGYDYSWQQYSKWFLRQPGNQICKLHLDGCTEIATCVDHIDPPDGRNDPRFRDPRNHQAACIHCNSVKRSRKIVGTYDPIQEIRREKHEAVPSYEVKRR